MRKILALDGGGIKGLMTAIVLRDIERQLPGAESTDLNKTNIIKDHFDLVAGTSTGSILAAAICTGRSLNTIVELYENKGQTIFQPNLKLWGNRVMRAFSQGVSHPKHSDKGLAKELKAEFSNGRGAIKLGSKLIKTPLLIQAFDATLHEPIVFKSHHCDDKSDKDLNLWEVVKASSSAPTFFPSHSLQYRDHKELHAMIDGGVFANNPSMIALSEAFSLGWDDNENILLVSLGTSEEIAQGISAKKGKELGAMEWALPLFEIFMGGASRHVHSLAKRVLGSSGNEGSKYLRFQMLTEADIPMDEAATADIAVMKQLAQSYINGFPSDGAAKKRHLKSGYEYRKNLQELLTLIQ
jgi:patatin-like phospholipase/acyl hydrolase